jgi:hypothetical protein
MKKLITLVKTLKKIKWINAHTLGLIGMIGCAVLNTTIIKR